MNMNVKVKKPVATTESDEYEERSQEEHQIVVDKNRIPKFRPIISESVKKSVILHYEKQKLHEIKQQLFEQENQRKEHEAMNQEVLNDEETHGMFM